MVQLIIPKLPIRKIEKLTNSAIQRGVTEIEDNGTRITMKRTPVLEVVRIDLETVPGKVWVGTFRNNRDENEEIVVFKSGDIVEKGDTIGKIEALKGEFEVISSFSGVVHDVLVSEGGIVQYGTELMIIEVKTTKNGGGEK